MATVNFYQRVGHREVCQIAAMRTSMLPLVDIVRAYRLLANQAVDTTLAPITNVLNFYGMDLATDSGHALMIWESGMGLNYNHLKAIIGSGFRNDSNRH